MYIYKFIIQTKEEKMEGSNIKYNSNANIKNNLKFILPSLLGIILFMIPIKYNDQITIPIADRKSVV